MSFQSLPIHAATLHNFSECQPALEMHLHIHAFAPKMGITSDTVGGACYGPRLRSRDGLVRVHPGRTHPVTSA